MKRICAAVIAAILSANFAHAQFIVGAGGVMASPSSNQTGYTVSSTDLIEGQVGTLGGGDPLPEGGGDIAVLTDGTFGGEGAYVDDALFGAGDVLTYVLSKPTFITSIATYAGGDAYRGSQAYTISYSLDGGKSYSTLGSVNYFNPLSGGPSPTDSKVVISNFALAEATDLRFTFAGVPDYGSDYNRYREIDVNGHALPLPEPSSYALVGFGLAALFATLRLRPTRA